MEAESEPTEGLAAGVARQTRGVRKASVISVHESSDFVDQHYEVLKELGKGAFGRVKLVRAAWLIYWEVLQVAVYLVQIITPYQTQVGVIRIVCIVWSKHFITRSSIWP